MVVEDAHWIDPTSRELLDLAVERVHSLPVLLIVTFRPEFQPRWSGHPQVTVLVLNRLDTHGRMSLVGQIACGKAIRMRSSPGSSTAATACPCLSRN